MLFWYFSDFIDAQQNPNRDLMTEANDSGVPEVILKRNRAGHYITPGQINGFPVVFLVDTGATGVALSQETARTIGLRPGRSVTTQTANGNARAYLTRLDRVGVGAIEQRDVAATISPGLKIQEVLLGMSFLRNLEILQQGDELRLRQL